MGDDSAFDMIPPDGGEARPRFKDPQEIGESLTFLKRGRANPARAPFGAIRPRALIQFAGPRSSYCKKERQIIRRRQNTKF